MPFDARHQDAPDPPPAAGARAAASPALRPLVGGVDRRVAVLALVLAAALISGLAWNLVATQSKGRKSLDDAMQRRAALTADLIGSAFMAARTPEAVRAEFGGRSDALRRAVQAASVASKGRVTVLDARGRVLAAAGGGSDPQPSARQDVQLALDGTPSLSDAFVDGRGGWVVELAVPYPSRWGRRVLLASGQIAVVHGFTKGFFATPSAFSQTQGYLIDGAGSTLSSTQPRGEGVPGPVLAGLGRGKAAHRDRTFVSAKVPSSRWRVVLSVPETVLYASTPVSAAWLLFGAFVAAIGALLALGFLAARRPPARGRDPDRGRRLRARP